MPSAAPVRRARRAAAVAALALSVAPVPAGAAVTYRPTLSVPECVLAGPGSVPVAGAGMVPDRPATLRVGTGNRYDPGYAESDLAVVPDATGAFTTALGLPALAPGFTRLDVNVRVPREVFERQAADGSTEAVTVREAFETVRLVRRSVVIRFESGRARGQGVVAPARPGAPASRLRVAREPGGVQFSAYGFTGGVRPERETRVYLHYVDPRGRSVRDQYMSTIRRCGEAHTQHRPLFAGSRRPAAGRWTFQFDTSPRYRRGTRDRVRMSVRVDRRGRVSFPGAEAKAPGQLGR